MTIKRDSICLGGLCKDFNICVSPNSNFKASYPRPVQIKMHEAERDMGRFLSAKMGTKNTCLFLETRLHLTQRTRKCRTDDCLCPVSLFLSATR